MYRWRTLTDEERRFTLAWRRQMKRPVHSPLHIDSGQRHYLVTAACYEHRPHIGHSVERMNAFTDAWLDTLQLHSLSIVAWVVLPNHYHALVSTRDVKAVLKHLGQLHGRTSFEWNGEEYTRGRQVWCNAAETVMKSPDHYHATLNYIHHNPVKHGYVGKWSEWAWSSAPEYFAEVGREEAERVWHSYPIDRYGHGWDDPGM